MVRNMVILLLSFGASFGFGVGFHIQGWKNLSLAGLGGLFTRAVYLLASALVPQRFLYTMIASFAASVYGELMARKRKVPAAYFIYPSIIPLIPGDLFHYAISAVIAAHWADFREYGINCLIALLGLSIGMMLSSTTIQSIRKGVIVEED